jgi:hypothetical protein
MPERFKFETLNTSFVNLAALVRFLREQEFFGKVHVELDEYEAYVFLLGSEAPHVWEHDHATGRDAEGEEAMQRLLVRAREPGGVITVEAQTEDDLEKSDSSADYFSVVEIPKDDSTAVEAEPQISSVTLVSAAVIAAVERAVQSTGMSFDDQFHIARVEIGDDYPFLDPTVGGFEYKKSSVTLTAQPAPSAYVQAVSEALKRVVNRVAKRQNESSFRERVAVELAMVARHMQDGLGEFTSQLDSIAGTRVL